MPTAFIVVIGIIAVAALIVWLNELHIMNEYRKISVGMACMQMDLDRLPDPYSEPQRHPPGPAPSRDSAT